MSDDVRIKNRRVIESATIWDRGWVYWFVSSCPGLSVVGRLGVSVAAGLAASDLR